MVGVQSNPRQCHASRLRVLATKFHRKPGSSGTAHAKMLSQNVTNLLAVMARMLPRIATNLLAFPRLPSWQ
jgi:hypothetical protein